MNDTILEAHDIHKTFDIPTKIQVLKGVNLIVSRGDTVAITGRSGEGKSTLLHILGTLEKPCRGSLKIVHQNVTPFNKIKIRRHHVAFIFQSFHLLEDYTSLENVLMPARIARQNVHKGSQAYSRAWNLLEQVDLTDRAHFRAKQLSGGEKQRVAIARALCNDPDIIFADEPTGNIDRQTAHSIHEMLFDFIQQNNKALVVVTHDPELANRCSRTFDLQDGVLIP